MLLNRALVFLCLVIAEGAQTEHRVTCYLDVLTPRTRQGPCTHIIVPAAWTNGTFNPQSLSEDDFDALGKMKERNPTLKILLGLEVEASRLELMFSSESSVENFTHTSLSYLKEKHFDGLDLTWVNGLSSESSDSSELLRNFLKSLREAFEEETRSSDRILLLSLSLSHQNDHSSAVGCDVRTLLQYVDFISLLPAHLEKDGPYINETIQHWHDQQVDLQKLNLALPAFLWRTGRRHHHHHHHPSNNDENTEEGKKHHIQGVGLKLANRVCLAIKSREEFITLTSLSDDPSLVKEVSWLLQKGFGGVGAVFIDMDGFFNTVCDSITQDERAIVKSKMIMHHGRRVHGLGGHHHHHHGREHHHSHRDHQSHLSHRSHDFSHQNHRHRHHHRHGHHGHHHHLPHPTPQ
ncbi:histidine-rich carboxyl terminus protein 1 [Triplophysa dalaica]|uniref:histidine-rich carboxyl terminus protein 1 n=1 Tax=Triplophysa dalaica TaxID=1582913 RepID=UPI0024E03387|nr:histidine-rich carboxyl terminus protein 1 [Triplophysa dalaica]